MQRLGFSSLPSSSVSRLKLGFDLMPAKDEIRPISELVVPISPCPSRILRAASAWITFARLAASVAPAVASSLPLAVSVTDIR